MVGLLNELNRGCMKVRLYELFAADVDVMKCAQSALIDFSVISEVMLHE